MIFNLLILVISIVYIWDHSGFIYSLTKFIYKKLYPNKPYMGQQLMKPFGCSMCISFWSVFIYSIFCTTFIYSLGIAVGMSLLSTIINKLFKNIINYINLL